MDTAEQIAQRDKLHQATAEAIRTKDELLRIISRAKQKVWEYTARTGRDFEPGTFLFDIEGAHYEIHKEFAAMWIFEHGVRAYFRGRTSGMSEAVRKTCLREAKKARRSAILAWATTHRGAGI